MVSRTRALLDPARPCWKEVRFTHAEPSYRAEFAWVFQAPEHFSSDSNAMLVDDSSPIGTGILRPSRYAFKILSARADALLAELANAKATRGRVEALLIPVLHRGEASIDRVAAEVGTSRQTLQRRLRAEGVRFDWLLGELRHRMASSYIDDKKVPTNETARLVGFSEPSAFSRGGSRPWESPPSPGKTSQERNGRVPPPGTVDKEPRRRAQGLHGRPGGIGWSRAHSRPAHRAAGRGGMAGFLPSVTGMKRCTPGLRSSCRHRRDL
jgi:AraC-like DNA-binding protein